MLVATMRDQRGPGIPDHLKEKTFGFFRFFEKSEETGLEPVFPREAYSSFSLCGDRKTPVSGFDLHFLRFLRKKYKRRVEIYSKEEKKGKTMEPAGNRIHVLHVDDEEEFLEITRMYLENLYGNHLKITSVTHPEQVADKLKESDYDLVVSDYQMPGMDGLELLGCLRDQNINIPFIMFTGRGREEVAIKALNLGADYYLQKGHPEVAFTELHHFITIAVHKNRAEKKLRKSEENLRNAQSIAHLGSWEWDVATNTVKLSEEMFNIFGLDYGESVPPDITSLINRAHPDDRMKVQEALETTTKELKTGPMEYRIITPAGNEKWILVDSRVIKGESGELEKIFGYVLDITERKKAEEELKRSEARLREIIDLVPHFIYAKDMEGRHVLTNKAVAGSYGLSPEDFIGKTYEDLIEHLDREHLKEQLREQYQRFLAEDREIIKSGKTMFIPEETVTDINGKQAVFQTTKIPFTSAGMPAVLGISMNITKLKQSEKSLRESEQKYRELVEKMMEGVVVEDANGIMTFVNPQAAKMTGYSVEELTGKHWSVIIHESVKDKVEKETAKRSRDISSTYESIIKTKDNKLVSVLVHASPLFSEKRIFRGVLVVFTDISELKQAEDLLMDEKKQFWSMLDQSPFAIAVYSPDGRLKNINQAFMDSWDVPTAIKEYLLANYNIFQDEQLKAMGVVPDIQRAFAGETVVIPEARYDSLETEVTRDTGLGMFWVRTYIYPVKNERGSVREVILMFEDLSRQKKVEE